MEIVAFYGVFVDYKNDLLFYLKEVRSSSSFTRKMKSGFSGKDLKHLT